MATTLNQKASNLASIIAQHKAEILSEWLRDMGAANRRSDLMKDSELKAQCSQFVELLAQAPALLQLDDVARRGRCRSRGRRRGRGENRARLPRRLPAAGGWSLREI